MGPYVPIIFYTHPSTGIARTCFTWGGAGISRLILAGIDDRVAELRTVVGPLDDASIEVGSLIGRLERRLALLPLPLSVAVRRLFSDFSRIDDLDTFASSVCMSRRTAERWLRRQGLPTPGRLLAAARLLRAHRALAGGTMSLHGAASAGGFSSHRSLALRSRTMLGGPPSVLRRLRPAELQERLGELLGSVGEPSPACEPA